RAASGHAAAAPPPSRAMNSRRLMGAFPKAKDDGPTIAGLEWGGGVHRNKKPRLMSAMGHVWTAPPWQELSELLQHWSGAVMCPACLCGGEAAGHNALRGSGPNR